MHYDQLMMLAFDAGVQALFVLHKRGLSILAWPEDREAIAKV
jgi:hypothetical protein